MPGQVGHRVAVSNADTSTFMLLPGCHRGSSSGSYNLSLLQGLCGCTLSFISTGAWKPRNPVRPRLTSLHDLLK